MLPLPDANPSIIPKRRGQMLLIYPPLAKACEPPAGITQLAGFLRGHKQDCSLWDANLEGQLYLLNLPQNPQDTWSKRAWKNIDTNLMRLRGKQLYNNHDRYQRAVRDLNRALSQSCQNADISLTLADYQDSTRSPHQSRDLLRAARDYQDSLFYPFYQERLPSLLPKDPEGDPWIGISLNYLSQALESFALAGFLRQEYPSYNIVIGGGLITSWLRSPGWSNPFGTLFDHMVAGKGERPLLQLLQPPTLGAPPFLDHQAPDYHGLPLADYLAPVLILPYSASRGCYWNRCSFCPEKAEGSPYQGVASDQAMADLSHLVDTFRPSLIHFLDNAVAPSLMKKLIAKPPGPDWYGFARVITEFCDPYFCQDLRTSGCVLLKLGIESGSQKILDSMDKGINLQMVTKALDNLRLAGIATYVYLLFGTPAESLLEARETLEFTVHNAAAITYLNLAIFNLPRNSSEAEDLELCDFSRGDLGLYSDFRHPRGWDRKAVRNFLSREFKADPTIRQIMRRDPPFFTSNHAALTLK